MTVSLSVKPQCSNEFLPGPLPQWVGDALRVAADRKNGQQDKKFVPNTADKLLTINDDDDDWTLEKRRGGSVTSNL